MFASYVMCPYFICFILCFFPFAFSSHVFCFCALRFSSIAQETSPGFNIGTGPGMFKTHVKIWSRSMCICQRRRIYVTWLFGVIEDLLHGCFKIRNFPSSVKNGWNIFPEYKERNFISRRGHVMFCYFLYINTDEIPNHFTLQSSLVKRIHSKISSMNLLFKSWIC